jgi:hypothetical protein
LLSCAATSRCSCRSSPRFRWKTRRGARSATRWPSPVSGEGEAGAEGVANRKRQTSPGEWGGWVGGGYIRDRGFDPSVNTQVGTGFRSRSYFYVQHAVEQHAVDISTSFAQYSSSINLTYYGNVHINTNASTVGDVAEENTATPLLRRRRLFPGTSVGKGGSQRGCSALLSIYYSNIHVRQHLDGWRRGGEYIPPLFMTTTTPVPVHPCGERTVTSRCRDWKEERKIDGF